MVDTETSARSGEGTFIPEGFALTHSRDEGLILWIRVFIGMLEEMG